MNRARMIFWILLFPLSLMWLLVALLRRAAPSSGVAVSPHVICVGNIHSGGSGKSPVVLELAKILSRTNNVVVVSRGYRSQFERSEARVDSEDTKLYGDEPVMLARESGVPVFVGRNRKAVIERVRTQFPKAFILLDDGFQRRDVRAAWNIVVINVEKDPLYSFGLPLGELREPISATKRANAVLLVGEEGIGHWNAWESVLKDIGFQGRVERAHRIYRGLFEGSASVSIAPLHLLGFSGIASPLAFQREIKRRGGEIIGQFPDHHVYTDKDIDRLIQHRLKHPQAILVTTDKDWYKLEPKFRARNEKLLSLKICCQISEQFQQHLLAALPLKDLAEKE